MSPFQRVIFGLALGVAVGLFVGEPAGALSLVGDAYIRLLQMTVLPYVLVSLTVGLGSLDAAMARRIGLRGGGMILVLWGAALLTLLCLPLAYPTLTSAAFFSASLVAEPEVFDPLALYLPANPFYSLGHGAVPAVVFFSISLGLALISVENKDGLLKGLRNVADALMKIASFVGKIAPIGIFAISAAAAGTLSVDELSRLQVFLWVYVSAWLVLTFFTLPLLVSWATPFSYGQALRESRTPMVTAFATGTVLVVLPMIAERCKELLAENGLDAPEAEVTVDVLVPTAYSFPSVGTLLGLGFVLFAAWYVGAPLTVDQYPAYVGVGALVAFGSMAVAIPYMLDLFSLSADLFQLYLLGSVVTARFATALAAMHGVVVCLLGATAVLGRTRLRSLGLAFAASVGVALVSMWVLGAVLTRAVPNVYLGEEAFVSMELHGKAAPVRQHESVDALAPRGPSAPRLESIRGSGRLRVAYLPDRLPFAYRSTTGEVVGYDLDLVHRLARDLGVAVDLVRIDWSEAVAALDQGRVDVIVGGIAVTPERAEQVTFSRSYFDQSLAFAVRDHDRASWSDLAELRARSELSIAMGAAPYYAARLREILPDAEFVEIASARPFFRGEVAAVDALGIGAETGSAWTLIYPDYSVVVPEGLRVKGSTGFALPTGEEALERFVDTWLELVEANGYQHELYRHWILGEHGGQKGPRWSIMKDVLGWGAADAAP